MNWNASPTPIPAADVSREFQDWADHSHGHRRGIVQTNPGKHSSLHRAPPLSVLRPLVRAAFC
jgi:hypothetical protein